MSFAVDDLQFMFDDFGVDVAPTTWGGDTRRGILDREYTEVSGVDVEIGRVRSVLTLRETDVPASRSVGDLVTINSVQHKCVDYRQEEVDLIRVVLADV